VLEDSGKLGERENAKYLMINICQLDNKLKRNNQYNQGCIQGFHKVKLSSLHKIGEKAGWIS